MCFAPYFNMHLFTNKREALTKLQKKLGNLISELLFDISFVSFLFRLHKITALPDSQFFALALLTSFYIG